MGRDWSTGKRHFGDASEAAVVVVKIVPLIAEEKVLQLDESI
jgi:hypothetical protein